MASVRCDLGLSRPQETRVPEGDHTSVPKPRVHNPSRSQASLQGRVTLYQRPSVQYLRLKVSEADLPGLDQQLLENYSKGAWAFSITVETTPRQSLFKMISHENDACVVRTFSRKKDMKDAVESQFKGPCIWLVGEKDRRPKYHLRPTKLGPKQGSVPFDSEKGEAASIRKTEQACHTRKMWMGLVAAIVIIAGISLFCWFLGPASLMGNRKSSTGKNVSTYQHAEIVSQTYGEAFSRDKYEGEVEDEEREVQPRMVTETQVVRASELYDLDIKTSAPTATTATLAPSSAPLPPGLTLTNGISSLDTESTVQTTYGCDWQENGDLGCCFTNAGPSFQYVEVFKRSSDGSVSYLGNKQLSGNALYRPTVVGDECYLPRGFGGTSVASLSALKKPLETLSTSGSEATRVVKDPINPGILYVLHEGTTRGVSTVSRSSGVELEFDATAADANEGVVAGNKLWVSSLSSGTVEKFTTTGSGLAPNGTFSAPGTVNAIGATDKSLLLGTGSGATLTVVDPVSEATQSTPTLSGGLQADQIATRGDQSCVVGNGQSGCFDLANPISPVDMGTGSGTTAPRSATMTADARLLYDQSSTVTQVTLPGPRVSGIADPALVAAEKTIVLNTDAGQVTLLTTQIPYIVQVGLSSQFQVEVGQLTVENLRNYIKTTSGEKPILILKPVSGQMPQGFSFDPASGSFSMNPTQKGVHQFDVEALSERFLGVKKTFSFLVGAGTPATVAIPVQEEQTVQLEPIEEQEFSYTIDLAKTFPGMTISTLQVSVVDGSNTFLPSTTYPWLLVNGATVSGNPTNGTQEAIPLDRESSMILKYTTTDPEGFPAESQLPLQLLPQEAPVALQDTQTYICEGGQTCTFNVGKLFNSKTPMTVQPCGQPSWAGSSVGANTVAKLSLKPSSYDPGWFGPIDKTMCFEGSNGVHAAIKAMRNVRVTGLQRGWAWIWGIGGAISAAAGAYKCYSKRSKVINPYRALRNTEETTFTTGSGTVSTDKNGICKVTLKKGGGIRGKEVDMTAYLETLNPDMKSVTLQNLPHGKWTLTFKGAGDVDLDVYTIQSGGGSGIAMTTFASTSQLDDAAVNPVFNGTGQEV